MPKSNFSLHGGSAADRRSVTLTAPLTHRRSRRTGSADSSGMAFLVEVLALVLLLAASLAVLVQVFSSSQITARQSVQAERAVSLASQEAEAFAADPTSLPQDQTQEGLTATCQITPKATAAGTLYDAHITVTDEAGNQVYELTSSRYVSGGGA